MSFVIYIETEIDFNKREITTNNSQSKGKTNFNRYNIQSIHGNQLGKVSFFDILFDKAVRVAVVLCSRISFAGAVWYDLF